MIAIPTLPLPTLSPAYASDVPKIRNRNPGRPIVKNNVTGIPQDATHLEPQQGAVMRSG